MIHFDKDPSYRSILIQEALAARGLYTGAVDNWFGPRSEEALESFKQIMDRARKLPDTPTDLDPRTLKNIATLDPKARGEFERLARIGKNVAAKHGCDYVGISGNRTYAEQDVLYAKGRTTPGPKVTNAKGGQSNHNFGIAMDFGAFRNGKYLDSDEPATAWGIHKAVAHAAKDAGLNLEWGGDWTTIKDAPHFEIRTGLSSAEKRARMAKSGSVL